MIRVLRTSNFGNELCYIILLALDLSSCKKDVIFQVSNAHGVSSIDMLVTPSSKGGYCFDILAVTVPLSVNFPPCKLFLTNQLSKLHQRGHKCSFRTELLLLETSVVSNSYETILCASQKFDPTCEEVSMNLLLRLLKRDSMLRMMQEEIFYTLLPYA